MKNYLSFFFTLLTCLFLTACGSDNAKMTGKGIFKDIPQYILKYYELNKQCADELEFEDNKDKRTDVVNKYQEQWEEYVKDFMKNSPRDYQKEVPVVAAEEYGITNAYINAENMDVREINDKYPKFELMVEMSADKSPYDNVCFFLDERDSVIYCSSVRYFQHQAKVFIDFSQFNPYNAKKIDDVKCELYALDKIKKIKFVSSSEERSACMRNYWSYQKDFIESLLDAGIIEKNSVKGLENKQSEQGESDNVDKTKPGAIDLAFFNLRGPVKLVSEKNDSYDNTRRYGFSEKGKWETQDGQKIGNIFTDVKRDSEKRIIEYTEGEYDCIDSYKITYDAKTGWVAKCETSAGDGETTTTYTYDANGYAVKSVTIGEYLDDEGGSKVNTTTTYTYVEFDDYGNWTKRTVKDSDGSSWTETRKITYYK